MKKEPLFIVFEGIDGSGKTTQIKLLEDKFVTSGLKTMITGEPTNGIVGSLLSEIMIGKIHIDQSTIAALFLADRLDHVTNPVNGMKKNIQEGFNVICSRYYFSSFAFQSEYVPIDWLIDSNTLSKSYLKPDLIFYLNIDPFECYHRVLNRGLDIEIYENLEKLKNTHDNYLETFKKYGADENIHVINGSQSISNIHHEIWEITKQTIDG